MNIVITGVQVSNSFSLPILSGQLVIITFTVFVFRINLHLHHSEFNRKKCSKDASLFKMCLLTWKQQLVNSALKIHHFHIKYRFYTSRSLFGLFFDFEPLFPFLENNFHDNITNLLLTRPRDFDEFNEIEGMLMESWNKLTQHFDVLEDIIQDTVIL
jgi:hypothetical protein